jgi:hypothetical protein
MAHESLKVRVRQQFGSSISFDGSVALIGAIGDEVVFLFRYDRLCWLREGSLDAPPEEEFIYGSFGNRKAITVSLFMILLAMS